LAVGGCGVPTIEQLAGEQAPFAPPLVGILPLRRSAGRRDRRLGGRGDLVLMHQAVQAAQRKSGIVAGLAGGRVEQRLRLVGVRQGGRAGLDDRNLGIAQPFGGAHRSGEILGADAAVHPRDMIGARQEVGKLGQHGRLGLGRELARVPGRADRSLGAGTIAGGEQHARERELAIDAGRLAADEAAHHRRIATLLPQPRLGAPAQQRNARPLRVVDHERDVAAEGDVAVAPAQQHPFDQPLCHRIGDRPLERRRVLELTLADEVERLPYRRELRRQVGERRPVLWTVGRRRFVALLAVGRGAALGVLAVLLGLSGLAVRLGCGLAVRLGRGFAVRFGRGGRRMGRVVRRSLRLARHGGVGESERYRRSGRKGDGCDQRSTDERR
jgi:hypothetical protein